MASIQKSWMLKEPLLLVTQWPSRIEKFCNLGGFALTSYPIQTHTPKPAKCSFSEVLGLWIFRVCSTFSWNDLLACSIVVKLWNVSPWVITIQGLLLVVSDNFSAWAVFNTCCPLILNGQWFTQRIVLYYIILTHNILDRKSTSMIINPPRSLNITHMLAGQACVPQNGWLTRPRTVEPWRKIFTNTI